jgi:hypothetical protein
LVVFLRLITAFCKLFCVFPGALGRGRDDHHWPPPRIRMSAAKAYGSYLRYVALKRVTRIRVQDARWGSHLSKRRFRFSQFNWRF